MNAPENLIDQIIPGVLYRILFGRRTRNRALVNSMLRRAWQEGYAAAMADEKQAMKPVSEMERAEVEKLTIRESQANPNWLHDVRMMNNIPYNPNDVS